MAIDYKKANTQRVTVTAHEATEMLARNLDNRPISPGRVKEMADKMTKLGELRARLGREPTDDEIVAARAWLFTHQGIAFDTRGRMTDGQHRLTAQARSGVTLDWVVTTGLAPEAFDRTDIGDVRSAADLLSRRVPNLRNKSLCAASARAALLGLDGHTVDKEVVVDFVEKNAEMVDDFVRELRKNKTVSRAPIIGAFIAAARPWTDPFPGPRGARYRDLLMVSAMRLSGQEWTGKKDDPLKTLHNRLLADERAAMKSGRATDPKTLYALTVGALRAELAGRGLAQIPGTDIDWGDLRDNIRDGTGDLSGRRSISQRRAFEEGRRTASAETAAPLEEYRQRKREEPKPDLKRPASSVRRGG